MVDAHGVDTTPFNMALFHTNDTTAQNAIYGMI